MYKSRRVPFSLFVNIPLTTPRINFRISECHHRFSIDLIIIFSAKNGNSKKNTLGPYWSFNTNWCSNPPTSRPQLSWWRETLLPLWSWNHISPNNVGAASHPTKYVINYIYTAIFFIPSVLFLYFLSAHLVSLTIFNFSDSPTQHNIYYNNYIIYFKLIVK